MFGCRIDNDTLGGYPLGQGCEGMSILTSNMNVQLYTYTYNIYGIYDIYLPRFIIQNEKKKQI